MSATSTFFAIFALFATSGVLAFHGEDPYCFHLGRKLFGKNLDGVCVHHTDDYSVSFEVSPSGSVEMVMPAESSANLEVYSGARVVTPWEDCCPPETFLHEVSCPRIEESGSCCYTEDQVKVWGVPHVTGCLHSVEDYASYVPIDNGAMWNTSNPQANNEVEVYASLHPNGCCECFMYALPCSPCQED